jgi:signal transduction histidine kinase
VSANETVLGPRRRWDGLLGNITGNLRAKLTIMIVLVAMVPMLAIAVISVGRASETITQEALATSLAENRAAVSEIEQYLKQFPDDLLTFSNSPPIQGIIRALDNGGIDPESNDSFEVWADRLDTIFAAAELYKKVYRQLRFLDENGNEIVRVDFDFGETTALTGTDQLQNQSHRPYFFETKELPKDSVLVSDLNLNREFGAIEVPYVPVLRYSTPIFDQTGEFRGIVVSNVDATALVRFIERAESRTAYMATKDLSLAIHPDPEMLWGGDLGTGITLDTEFEIEHGILKEAYNAESGGAIVHQNDERGEIVALGTVQFDPVNSDNYWIIGTSTSTAEVLAGVTELYRIIIVAVIVVALAAALLAFWLASYLANRIGTVTRAIGRISLGDLGARISFRSSDEIGQLADSYRDMVVYLGALTDAATQIADGDLTANVTPASKNDALGNAFLTMIGELRAAAVQRDAALELEIENRELLRVNMVRNEFLSTVSHELRTPLTSLLAFGDILAKDRDGTLTERQLEQLGLMRSNGWKLEALVNDLLDVSQSEAGTFRIEKTELELTEVVRQIAASTQSVFERKNQTLTVKSEVDSAWVDGDEQRITQVLNNLLTNASKYSAENTETVIRLSQTVDRVNISVEDSGIGIKPSDIARLFTPFFRVNSTETRKEGGTGLGLAIARTIVQLHGGDIFVNSTLGVGTTMRVQLPMANADAVEPRLLSSSTAART